MFGKYENHLSENAKDFLPLRQKVERLKLNNYTIITRGAQ